MEGLSRLEYRGYDSAGFACLNSENSQIVYAKTKGSLSNLIEKIDQEPIDGFLGIGHTRWATHGHASSDNAHPHFDCQKTISVVHNGIIENHHMLKEQLQSSGHVFHSDTDSEVIAHLLEAFVSTSKDVKASVIKLVEKLEGAFSFVAILQNNPDFMVVVRKRSPLCIGVGQDEMFVASDIQAFAGKTNKVLFLPDESFAFVRKDMVDLYDFSGNHLSMNVQEFDLNLAAAEKQGHDHFMLKEIYEQKSSIYSTLEFLDSINDAVWDQMGISQEQAANLKHISLVGCGTSWHAARIAQFFFEEICMIPTTVLLASEFRYRHFFPQEDSLYIAISQSGAFSANIAKTYIFNSNGLEVHSKESLCSISSHMIAKDKTTNDTSFGFEYQLSRILADINAIKVAKTALKKAKLNLNRKKIKKVKVPLILSPQGTNSLILKPLATAINAESYQYNRSFLVGLRGETIGSEHLNIEDNALYDRAVGSSSFDGEGVPCQNKKIITKGLLHKNGLLHNYYTAGKDGVESTGNAARSSYSSIPRIGISNFILKPGNQSRDDLFKDIKYGILLNYTGDRPNLTTGDFSGLILQGNIIENGEIKEPLNETMLAINLLDLYKKIEAVSKESRTYGSFQSPYVKVGNVQIVGSVN